MITSPSSTQKIVTPPVYAIPNWQNFIFSSSAPVLAVLFTNPFDTAKVRLQLQGQLQPNQRIYRNSLDTLWKIARHEGLRGLQQGRLSLFNTQL
jgi:solute carrier family 25 protein 34/35